MSQSFGGILTDILAIHRRGEVEAKAPAKRRVNMTLSNISFSRQVSHDDFNEIVASKGVGQGGMDTEVCRTALPTRGRNTLALFRI